MPTYSEMTGKTIEEAFEKFHNDNPRIYQLFVKFALYLIRDKQKKKISSQLIIVRIRWEIYVETESDDNYRISNNYTPYYARLFIKQFPEYKDYFVLRKLTADSAPKPEFKETLF